MLKGVAVAKKNKHSHKQLAKTGGEQSLDEVIGKIRPNNEQLRQLRRSQPYYRRNLPHICTFWVKGECKRGEECPFRHERPSDPDDPLADQNIKDRFYGTNDPVASKLLNRMATLPKLVAPEDKSMTTLYIGGVTDVVNETNLT